MFDRQLVGDVGLAILLAFPTLALARPQPLAPETGVSTVQQFAAIADRTSAERRFSVDDAASG